MTVNKFFCHSLLIDLKHVGHDEVIVMFKQMFKVKDQPIVISMIIVTFSSQHFFSLLQIVESKGVG